VTCAYAGPVLLLFVCTGNLCRSPFAERRTRSLLGDGRIGVSAGSAGTRAVIGSGMDVVTAGVLAEYGGSADGHRARQLTPGLVAEADLVLVMTTAHRTAVLELSPGSLRKTFSLLEAAGLLAELDPADDPLGLADGEHLDVMTGRMARARGNLARPHPGFPDIPDPIGQAASVHRAVAELIEGALRDLLARLVPGAAAL
jgi:protein-tyrosine phosphatase